jgi:hypothetical protein
MHVDTLLILCVSVCPSCFACSMLLVSYSCCIEQRYDLHMGTQVN